MSSTAVDWRRDLHAHPEVGFTEFRTVSRVAGRLADLGWDVVLVPGAHHTPRFDIDEAVLGPGVDLLERVVRGALLT